MSHRSPLTVVQAQLDAYNAKDVEALLETYAHDAEQYTLHGERLAKGHEQLRTRFLASVVVDYELITRNFPEGLGTLEMLCVYEVVAGRIQKASFAVGEKRVHVLDKNPT